MTPTAEKLLEAAKNGDKIGTADRRHVVAYMMATQPHVTNVELAEVFGVTERTIRADKLKVREERSKRIKEEDVGLVIADILIDFDRNIADIEKSKKAAKAGSGTYLAHCVSAMDMRLKTAKALQDLGYLPKNLGNMTVTKFNYQSVVLKDGHVETRRVESFEDVQDAEVEDIAPKELPPAAAIELGKANAELEPEYLQEFNED